ncbi:MAG: SPOR domain-containing protein [Bacteroidales bacterium]|nr:SPOR domain-containing protein [Bacteroidales bacterium]
MTNKLISTIVLLIIMSGIAFAQSNPYYKGKVEIIQDYRISQLVDKHAYLNQEFDELEGFRIQIYFDSGNNSKNNALIARDEFLEKYDGARAYISFKEPYYQVRVGDFRTRLDAEGYLQKIIDEYPYAFTVKDKINFPPLSDEPINTGPEATGNYPFD